MICHENWGSSAAKAEDQATTLIECLQTIPWLGIIGVLIIIRTLGLQLFLENIKVFPILPQKDDKRRNNSPENKHRDGNGTEVESGKQIRFHNYLPDITSGNVATDASSRAGKFGCTDGDDEQPRPPERVPC